MENAPILDSTLAADLRRYLSWAKPLDCDSAADLLARCSRMLSYQAAHIASLRNELAHAQAEFDAAYADQAAQLEAARVTIRELDERDAQTLRELASAVDQLESHCWAKPQAGEP